MNKYTLIDLPVYVAPEMYEINVAVVCSALMNHGKIESVYRIGSVTAPGISDIDLLVVFKDGAATAYDPLKKLDEIGQYLYIHNLFGCSHSHFQEAFKVTQFHNYRLIGGTETRPLSEISKSDLTLLNQQTALEYMIKMIAVMSVQRSHRVLKVRSFLLEARALEYDLEFLGISSGELFEVIQQIIELRKKWFVSSSSQAKVEVLFDKLFALLTVFVSDILETHKFYTPGLYGGKFASNIFWRNDLRLIINSKGIPLPAFPVRFLKKKYFNLMGRFRNFYIKMPVDTHPPAILKKRFELNSEMNDYNSKNIPLFTSPASSLKFR